MTINKKIIAGALLFTFFSQLIMPVYSAERGGMEQPRFEIKQIDYNDEVLSARMTAHRRHFNVMPRTLDNTDKIIEKYKSEDDKNIQKLLLKDGDYVIINKKNKVDFFEPTIKRQQFIYMADGSLKCYQDGDTIYNCNNPVRYDT